MSEIALSGRSVVCLTEVLSVYPDIMFIQNGLFLNKASLPRYYEQARCPPLCFSHWQPFSNTSANVLSEFFSACITTQNLQHKTTVYKRWNYLEYIICSMCAQLCMFSLVPKKMNVWLEWWNKHSSPLLANQRKISQMKNLKAIWDLLPRNMGCLLKP